MSPATVNAPALLAGLRDRHPELRAPLTWKSLRRVLDRENIELCTLPIRQSSRLMVMGGAGVLTVQASLSPRVRLRVAVEQFLHWLAAPERYTSTDSTAYSVMPLVSEASAMLLAGGVR